MNQIVPFLLRVGHNADGERYTEDLGIVVIHLKCKSIGNKRGNWMPWSARTSTYS